MGGISERILGDLEVSPESASRLLEERHCCLGDLAEYLGVQFSAGPVVGSAIIAHVFQELAKQFYERGTVYFENFGWLRYSDGEVVFSKNSALDQTIKKMDKAIQCENFDLAGIELVVNKKLRELGE